MNREEIQEILDIKEDCINKIIELLNVQLKLVRLARANKIEFEKFTKAFDRLENAKASFISLKEDCSKIIDQYMVTV